MIEYNTWVYYLAIVLCGVGALYFNAAHVEYSLLEATSGEKHKRPAQVYIVAFILVAYIVFWAAIRNGVVDTAEYIYGYEHMTTKLDFHRIFSEDEKAPLFELYQIILKRLGFNWQQFLASVAIISGIFIFYGVGKYADDVPLSIYLFTTGLYAYWLFNGIRQFFVVSVLFACLRLIVEKKLIKYLIIVFILYFVHSTVIIMVPIYFIANMKNWSYGIYACILATMAVVILFPNQFVALLDDSFTEYNVAENFAKDDGVNIFRFLVAMVTPTLALIYRRKIEAFNNKYVNVLVNLSLISAGLYEVGVVTSGIYIGRLPMFVDMFSIILLPFILKKVLPPNTKGPIFVSCLILYFIYFYLQAKDGGLYYTTNLIEGMDLGGGQL